jgi:amino acid transporter
VQNATTLAKVAGLMVVVFLALVVVFPATGGHFAPFIPSGGFDAKPFGLALIAVLWAYSGWDTVCGVGGEMANPRRNIPRSILLGTIAITAIYMLANIAYLIAMPGTQIAKSPLVAADTAELAIGGAGVLLVCITVALSTFGILNSNLMTSPRLPFRMAEDGLFFRPFAAVHPRYATPAIAIAFRTLQIIFFVCIGSFEELAGVAVVGGLPFSILATAAIFKLRRSKEYDPPVRTPLYPWVPLIVVLASFALFVNSLNEPRIIPKLLIGLAVLVAALPVYYLAHLGTAKPVRYE